MSIWSSILRGIAPIASSLGSAAITGLAGYVSSKAGDYLSKAFAPPQPENLLGTVKPAAGQYLGNVKNQNSFTQQMATALRPTVMQHLDSLRNNLTERLRGPVQGYQMQPMFASQGRPSYFMSQAANPYAQQYRVSGYDQYAPEEDMYYDQPQQYNQVQYAPFGTSQAARYPDMTSYGGGMMNVAQTAANNQGKGFSGYTYGLNGAPERQLSNASYLGQRPDNGSSFGSLQPTAVPTRQPMFSGDRMRQGTPANAVDTNIGFYTQDY